MRSQNRSRFRNVSNNWINESSGSRSNKQIVIDNMARFTQIYQYLPILIYVQWSTSILLCGLELNLELALPYHFHSIVRKLEVLCSHFKCNPMQDGGRRNVIGTTWPTERLLFERGTLLWVLRGKLDCTYCLDTPILFKYSRWHFGEIWRLYFFLSLMPVYL